MKTLSFLCSGLCLVASLSVPSKLPVIHPTFTTLGTVTDTVVNWQAAASPNGRFVLYTSNYGDLRLYDVRSRRATVIAPSSTWAFWPTWSPTGDVVAFSHENENGEAAIFTIEIDPNTGVAKGTPRRVTVNGGVNPSFSPDGKWIAYNRTDSDRDPQTELLLIPSNGGAPRTLARGELAMPTKWSPDGRWIYYIVGGARSAFPDGSREFDVYRVRIDGSSSERVTRSAGTWPGLTNDGRFLVTRDGSTIDTLRHAIVSDANGKAIATFTSPAGDEIGHWVDNYRFLIVRDDQRRVLRRTDLNGRSSQDIASAGSSVETESISPDGKHVAVFERKGGRTNLIVMSSDGTNRRVVPLFNMAVNAQPRWSPDSRYIAYIAGLDAPRKINIYDVQSTSVRTVLSYDKPLGAALWRPNSKSLLYVRFPNFGASPEPNDFAVHEVTLEGRDQTLRTIPSQVLSSGTGPTGILLGQSMAISFGSAGMWAVPYDGGAPRQLRTGMNTRTTFLPDERALVHGVELNPDGSFREIEVLGTDGIVVRNIRLPFDGLVNASDRHIELTPEGRDAIIVGRDRNAQSPAIYRVPLDGSAPRLVVKLAGRPASQIDVSPDGKSILYTVMGPRASSFVLVDLTPELTRLATR